MMHLGREMSRRRAFFHVISVSAALLLASAMVLTACTDTRGLNSGAVVYDFVENFKQAGSRLHTLTIDFGTPGARRHLVRGWSKDRKDRDGRTFVRSVGAQSVLEFFQREPRRLKVTVRCRSLGEGTFSIDLNGRSRQEVKVEPGSRDYRLVFENEAVLKGVNRLRFRPFRGRGARARVPGRLTTASSIDWEHLRFGRPSEDRRADAAAGLLYIPVGAQLDYYVKVPGGSAITFRGPMAPEARDARLQIVLQRDGEEPLTLANLETSTGYRFIPLPDGSPQIVRLSFRATPGDRPGRGGLTLVQPVVRSGRTQAEVAAGLSNRRPLVDGGPRRPNVIVYLIDALRADRLGCYGYPKPISPNMDAFARDAVLFEHAIAQSSWTKPSVASIFTGVWPGTHRVHDEGESLPNEAVTLAEVLQAAGINTAAFVANGHVTDRFGFDQGFDEFVFFRPSVSTHPLPTSDEVNRRVLEWLASQTEADPFFLYVHTVDPHSPYTPSPEFRERFAASVDKPDVGTLESVKALRRKGRRVTDDVVEDLVALYEAEVAFTDQSFGMFVAELKKLGRPYYDDALIILLSDHGEEFREHGGWEHGTNLYGEVLDLPLIIKFPSGDESRGRRVTHLAQHVDILPTILDYMNLAVPVHAEGASLLPVISRSDDGWPARAGFAHLNKSELRQACVVDGPWKLIRVDPRRAAAAGFELYDRAVDPLERRNVIDEHPVVAGYLEEQLELREFEKVVQFTPATGVVDEATRENLRALGYIE